MVPSRCPLGSKKRRKKRRRPSAVEFPETSRCDLPQRLAASLSATRAREREPPPPYIAIVPLDRSGTTTSSHQGQATISIFILNIYSLPTCPRQPCCTRGGARSPAADACRLLLPSASGALSRLAACYRYRRPRCAAICKSTLQQRALAALLLAARSCWRRELRRRRATALRLLRRRVAAPLKRAAGAAAVPRPRRGGCTCNPRQIARCPMHAARARAAAGHRLLRCALCRWCLMQQIPLAGRRSLGRPPAARSAA